MNILRFQIRKSSDNLRGIAEPQVFMQRISWRAEGLRGVAGLRWLYATGPYHISHTTTSPNTSVSPSFLHIEHSQCPHGFPIHVVPELHTYMVIVVSQGWLCLHASIR